MAKLESYLEGLFRQRPERIDVDGLWSAFDLLERGLEKLEESLPREPFDEILHGDLVSELVATEGPWGHPSLDTWRAHPEKAGEFVRGWWQPPQGLAAIDAVTVHHTLTHSPHWMAEHYSKKWNGEAYGHPTMPYSVWITVEGRILLCVPLHIRPWHDHTGYFNTHLSVGMAGRLHEYEPPVEQVDALAEFCKWCIDSPLMPKVEGTQQITGHMDWVGTQCPGWIIDQGKTDHWKRRFQTELAGIM